MPTIAERLQSLVTIQSNVMSTLAEKGVDMTSISNFAEFATELPNMTFGGGDGSGSSGSSGDLVDAFENGWVNHMNEISGATKIPKFAFLSVASIQTIDFPNASYIGNSAFFNCSNLTTANFSNCSYIGGSAFYMCSSLATVNFPNCSYIGALAFGFCSSLTIASFPNISYIGNQAFYGCNGLITIDFPNASYISDGAFSNCYGLTIASFPNVSYIGDGAFNTCTRLVSLYLLSTSIVSLPYSNAFSRTPIAGYRNYTGEQYGSIFVNGLLLKQYKSATNWSYFSDRIVALLAKLLIDNISNDTIAKTSDGEIVDLDSLYCDGNELLFYNKNWGKATMLTELNTDFNSSVTKSLTIPTDYITVTYSGLSDDVKSAITKISISYEDVTFEYDSLPATLAIPNEGTDVTLSLKIKGYENISRTDTVTSTQTITLSDPAMAIYEVVKIDSSNATEYTTLVDGSNFVVNGSYIQSGSVSYNVNNGHSKGYITFTTPSEIPSECNCVTIKCYASSESSYDFGYVHISVSDTPTYPSTYSNLSSATVSATTNGYMAKSTGNNSSVTTFASGELAPNTTYTISIGYVKDSSNNRYNDRFYIEEITFPQGV